MTKFFKIKFAFVSLADCRMTTEIHSLNKFTIMSPPYSLAGKRILPFNNNNKFSKQSIGEIIIHIYLFNYILTLNSLSSTPECDFKIQKNDQNRGWCAEGSSIALFIRIVVRLSEYKYNNIIYNIHILHSSQI